MKIVKRILIGLLCFVALLLLLLLALPLWISPVAKGVANRVVPSIVKTDFHLGDFALNPYAGYVRVGDVQLANPTNFTKENCVDLKKLEVTIAMDTVTSQKMIVRDVFVDGLTIVTTPTGSNFKQLAKDVTGEETTDAAPAPAVNEAPDASTNDVAAASTEKRVQIDRLVLKNVVLKYGIVPIPIPTIEMTGIGADKPEGASYADVAIAVYEAVMKSVGAIGDFGKSLFDAGADATTKTLDATIDATKETLDSFKNLFKRSKK